MLARSPNMAHVLELCTLAISVIDHANVRPETPERDDPGTYIAHVHHVKIVLQIVGDYDRQRYLDVWHNGIVLSVQWNRRGAGIVKFSPGEWEHRLRAGAQIIAHHAIAV